MIKTSKLNNSVFFHEIENFKFKLNKITINFITTLNSNTAALNAAVALILKKQCKKFPSTTLLGKKLKDLYGANLDADVLKFGNYQIISFSIAVLANRFTLNNEILLNDAFEILCEILFKPKMLNGLFYEEDVEIEKQNLLEIISTYFSDQQRLASIKATELLFENKPCANFKLGTPESVTKINKTNLSNAHKQLLQTSKTHIIATGCDNFENLKSTFQTYSNFLNYDKCIELQSSQFLISPNFKTKNEKIFNSVAQTKLVMGFASKKTISNSFNNAIKIMVALFGATPTSKLFTIVREKLNLCYYCKATFDIATKVIWVESAVDVKNLEIAQKAIVEQLIQLKLGNFSEQELIDAKTWLTTNLNSVSDNINSLENFCLFEILTLNKTTPEFEINSINETKLNEIVEMANLFEHVLTFALVNKN